MEAYKSELERVASFFQSVPGKFSEKNVKRLGAIDHFETFEDSIPGGRRLSLSGSIVVIDVDLVDGAVSNVSVSLASNPQAEDMYSFMASANTPGKRILESIQKPRLDQFASILGFLSRCDRFSTKAVDCFQALDKISAAISETVKKAGEPEVMKGFGVPQINPSRLGLGLKYYENNENTHYAFLDVKSGSRQEYALVYKDSWLTESGEWVAEDGPSEATGAHDTRGELILQLEPPLTISKPLALELGAVTASDNSIAEKFNQRNLHSSFCLERHPAFREHQDKDNIDVTVANLLPFEFVTVSQIPLSTPKNIPKILDHLRRYSEFWRLMDSLLQGRHIVQLNENDLSIADAMELKDKPVQFKSTDISVILQSDPTAFHAMVDLQIEQARATMTLRWDPHSFQPKVDINKPVNVKDLQKLVDHGKLGLAVSYALGSLNVIEHRGSMSFSK